MGHLYDSRDKAIPHKVKKGENLKGIADEYKGKKEVPDDLDWKEIALFNWATIKEGEVTRALCERVGSSVADAVNEGKSPESLTLDPDFGPSTPEPILVPKLWKAKGLDLNKQHTVQVKVHTPAPAVGITKLDKWFIPGHDTCDADYHIMGDGVSADAVTFEVYASNYGKLKGWNDGLPEFEPLPDVSVYSADAGEGKIRGWKGLSKCEEGALSPDNHALNVAFSPYTVVLRYAKKGTHKDARIDLDAFWVQFDDKDKPTKESCKVSWKLKNAEVKLGLLQIANGEGTVIYARGLNESDLKGGKVEWDGTDSSGTPVTRAKMPFRAQIQAHTGIDTADGLALAAMQTEVRLYVHKDTYPELKDKYDPLTDKVSLDFTIADVYHKDDAPERSAGSLWTKYKLAEAGFHPGPVTNASVNDDFTCALHEFQRSVPKGGGAGSAPFERMAIGGDNDETKDALAALQPKRKRPWFGKPVEPGTKIGVTWRPGNWDDPKSSDFLDRLRDPTKRMILWVDDRNWYTDGKYWKFGFYDTTVVVSDANLKAVHDNPADLGGATADGRGSFEDRDKRVDCDARDVARPWIPLQADFRLLGKGDGLDTEVATPGTDLAEIMRMAIGPLRVDWTFDEVEKTSTVVGVTENSSAVTDPLPELDTECDQIFSQLYHPSAVRGTHSRPVVTRTRMALRWALFKLQAKYDRKDVKRQSLYFNTPVTFGGIRPDDPTGAYFKAAFGQEDESLLPWKAKPDGTRESICTAVHDEVGQGKDNVFAKRIGRAGIYLHPSRMAGDGYQVRAQARFDPKGPYVFLNAQVLAKRYERLPQAHTVQFRLWRKTSIRGYVQWLLAGDWAAAGASCFDHLPLTGPEQWRAHYTACHVSIENELGASNTELVQTVNQLFPVEQTYKTLVAGMLETGDPRKNPLNFGWMSLSPNFVSPWSGHPLYGMTQPNMNPDFGKAIGELFREMNCVHVTVAIRLSMAMVNAIEAQTGRMRGHVMVQYQTTQNCHFNHYECRVCHAKHTYVQNSDRPIMNNAACSACNRATMLIAVGVWKGTYQCRNRHGYECPEAGATSTSHQGAACPSCGQALNFYSRRQTGVVTYSHSSPRGNKAVNGTPSPSCGFPGGVFWNFLGDATLWAHELGHNRHYEHSADAMQDKSNSARPQHDNIENPLVPTTEEDDNRGWDRACLMSYISSVKGKDKKSSYQPARDLPCFCYKCALKNRGWKVAGLPAPKGDLQDVAGV